MKSEYGFTNVGACTFNITPVDLAPVSNYAKITDEPTVAVMSNKTTPLDQGELLTYRCNDVDHVSTSQSIQNPAPVRNGVQYVVKLEEILRTTTDDGTIVCDEPVVAYLTIRHQKSGNITSALVEQIVKRLLGACYYENGTARFDDLMRSALVPTAN